MRILMPSNLFYPSNMGGPARTLYWLAKELVANGVEATVVTTSNFIASGLVQEDEWLDVDGIRVRYCKGNYRFSAKVVHNACKEMRQCDAVLFSSLCFLPNFFIALWALLTRKKIIWSPRGELFDSAIKGSKCKLFYFALLKNLFAKKALFHATSSTEEAHIRKYFGQHCRTVVLPNYVEMPKKIERDKNPNPYFLYMGRIAPIKAIDRLVEACCKSEAFRRSSYKLLLAGIKEGDYYKQLEKTISDHHLEERIQFLGEVSGNKKFQLYADARYLFLVSHSENFGNVVVEALSQGTPVVASKGTPWVTLEESNAGYWIDNSVEEITQTVDQLIEQNDAQYADMRHNAEQLAQAFDISRNIHHWISLLVDSK